MSTRSARRGFHVALDCVRGAGASAIPPLLERLGCRVSGINLEPDGRFPRAPEPVPENLGELGALVRRSGAAIGLAVDPDVDRLALVDELGEPIGEDYTLAFAVRGRVGSTQQCRGQRHGGGRTCPPAWWSRTPPARPARGWCGRPVGEANVARAIRDEGAVIGGEGNGGVMLPALHIGRDAPLGVALILHLLATIWGNGVAAGRVVAPIHASSRRRDRGVRSSGPLYDRAARRDSPMRTPTTATDSASPGVIAGSTCAPPAPSRSFD